MKIHFAITNYALFEHVINIDMQLCGLYNNKKTEILLLVIHQPKTRCKCFNCAP